MGCCTRRQKFENISKEQQWDWLNLSDFKSSSCLTPLSYGILYISLLISIACYCVDVFTAVNLLVRGQWSGIVQPAVPISISRWIFAGCIILSWVLLVYRWIRAVRAMRTGGVAQSYLDPLAVRVQSIRMGARGRGWRRFLVFAELTKNKKGSEYVALFCHYSFEAWLRILFAEGPRNAINAMTLYSVMQASLIPTGQHAAASNQSPILQFFSNLKTLAVTSRVEAAVLFGMLFTLIIWVFAFLSLAIACILYVMFLWHHIPSQDGGLYSYCKRKVDRRLQKIVGVKVNKALAKSDELKSKDDKKAANGGDRPFELKRQPTLPDLESSGDKLPDLPTLSHESSQATLPPYTSRPPTSNAGSFVDLQRQPTLPDVSLDSSRPPPTRSNTQLSAASNASFASNAPLMGSAVPMGYGPAGRAYSPVPLSRMDSDRTMASDRPLMNRSGTSTSEGSYRSYNPAFGPPLAGQGRRPLPASRNNTGYSDNQSYGRSTPAPLTRQNTGMSNNQYGDSSTAGPSPIDDGRSRFGPPSRQNTGMSNYQSDASTSAGPYPVNGGRSQFGPPSRQNTGMSNYQSGADSMSGPASIDGGRSQFNPPSRQNTGMSNYQPSVRSASGPSSINTQGRGTPIQMFPIEPYGRQFPASERGRGQQRPNQQYEMRPQPSQNPMQQPTQAPPPQSRFTPYNPNIPSASQIAPPIISAPQRDFTPSPTHRNFSAPLRSVRQPDFSNRPIPQRSGTAPLPQTITYDDSIYDSYSAAEEDAPRLTMPPRAATAGPGNSYAAYNGNGNVGWSR